MTIEFRCTQCQRLLRTGDDTAGRNAKCPACGAIVPIPIPGAPSVAPAHSSGNPFAAPSSPAGNPFAVPPPPPPPMSGPADTADATNPYRAPTAYAEGIEPTTGRVTRVFNPTVINVGDVINRSWQIFRPNMGICVGVFVTVMVANGAVSVLGNVVTSMMTAMGNNELVMLSWIVWNGLAQQLFSVWLGLGLTLFMLKLARGEDASFGDLLGGGQYLLTGILTQLLVGLIVVLGVLACVIPGIILMLMFSQFYYVIIDRNTGVIDTLSLSKQATTGNKLNLFLLYLVAAGIAILGLLAFCVGYLFAMPLINVMLAVAYLSMTGQATVATRAWQPQAV